VSIQAELGVKNGKYVVQNVGSFEVGPRPPSFIGFWRLKVAALLIVGLYFYEATLRSDNVQKGKRLDWTAHERRLCNEGMFQRHYRMSRNSFHRLKLLLEPHLSRISDESKRRGGIQPISPELKLFYTCSAYKPLYPTAKTHFDTPRHTQHDEYTTYSTPTVYHRFLHPSTQQYQPHFLANQGNLDWLLLSWTDLLYWWDCLRNSVDTSWVGCEER